MAQDRREPGRGKGRAMTAGPSKPPSPELLAQWFGDLGESEPCPSPDAFEPLARTLAGFWEAELLTARHAETFPLTDAAVLLEAAIPEAMATWHQQRFMPNGGENTNATNALRALRRLIEALPAVDYMEIRPGGFHGALAEREFQQRAASPEGDTFGKRRSSPKRPRIRKAGRTPKTDWHLYAGLMAYSIAEAWATVSEAPPSPSALTHTDAAGSLSSLARMSLEDAVQTKGLGAALCSAR